MVKGKVKFFHDKKGWGFIERESSEDVFVYYSDIKGDGHRTLVKGEAVEFDVIGGPKGDKAVNVVRVGANGNTHSHL
jgi:cold shock protein